MLVSIDFKCDVLSRCSVYLLQFQEYIVFLIFISGWMYVATHIESATAIFDYIYISKPKS